jgi:hypothetical protein
MATNGWNDVSRPDVEGVLQEPYEEVDDDDDYPGLRRAYTGPTRETLRCGHSPLALFFIFMPVALWEHIAKCSNEYNQETLQGKSASPYAAYAVY